MKKFFFYLILFSSLISTGQTQQNINKNAGTTSNVIATIDSIRFNSSSTTMEVVLQNGTVELHSIAEIINVNFISVNQSQHSCGATNVHNPSKTYGTMNDQQGNEYKTIVIGAQEWMAENLKTTIYRNGNVIDNLTDDSQWFGLTTGAWASYNNDNQYDCPYGKVYNWFAVADPRYLCPTGWHVPTDGEWTTLYDYLGGLGSEFAGGKMKTTGSQYWNSPNQYATNESGFSGLPGGYRDYYGDFSNVGYGGSWWSSSESGTLNAWKRLLSFDFGSAFKGTYDKRSGLSVRCLRD